MTKIADLKPGDRFEVMLGGKPRMTYIDKAGTQRFEPNEAVAFLVERNQYDGLNELSIAYQSGRLTFDDYLEFQLSINSSVSHFTELSLFKHLELYNPGWGEPNDEIELAPEKYLGSNLVWPVSVETSDEDVAIYQEFHIYPAMNRSGRIIGCRESDCEGYAVTYYNSGNGVKTPKGIYKEFETAFSVATSLANNKMTDHQARLMMAQKLL